MTDGQLLRKYAKDGSEAAFEEIVRRYLSLVEGIVRRKTGREDLVPEVSMQVFASMAAKADQLSKRESLGAWLVVATRFAARDAYRKERTHERYRRSLMDTSAQDSRPDSLDQQLWNDLGPLLDDALATLPEGERDAVVLRFYRQLPYRKIGVLLGRGEDAARKRVGRALQRLNRYFRSRGVATSATVIASGLGLFLASKPTAATVVSVSQKALETAAAGNAPSLLSYIMIMNQTKVGVVAVLALTCVALSTGGGYLIGQRQGVSSTLSRSASVRGEDEAAGAQTIEHSDETRLQALARDLIRAQQIASDHPSESYRVERLISSVKVDEFAPLVGLVKAYPGLDPEVKRVLHYDLVRAWAGLDGAAAMDACVNEPVRFRAGLLTLAIEKWALKEPELARDWLERDSADVDGHTLGRLAGPLFAAWALSDPAQAAAYVETLPYDQLRNVPERLSELGDADLREAFVTAAAMVSDESFRGRTMDRLMVSDKVDPGVIVKSFNALALTDPDIRRNATVRVVERLSQVDPVAAAAWLEKEGYDPAVWTPDAHKSN